MQQLSDEVMAGYRVVRKLGSGSRADLYLGVGTSGQVVLKVFRPQLSRDDVATELEALSRLDSPHCVRLLDVSGHPDLLPIAILNRIGRGSIAALLRDRESLEPGETVTLLAPLAAVLPTMHGVGVAHTRISAGSVHLGSFGEPVLIDFGHCALFDAGASVAALAAEPAVAADRQALAHLVAVVLARVRGAEGHPGVADLLDWLRDAPIRDDFAEQLEERLFQLAEPVPIQFARAGGVESLIPARIGDRGDAQLAGARSALLERPAPADAETQEPAPVPTGLPGFLTGLVPEWAANAIMNNPLIMARTRLRAAASTVRKPIWIAAGGVLLALVFALALIPQSGAATPAERSAAVSTESPAATGAASSDSPSSASKLSARTLPADPVLALPLLLTARTGCITEMSVLCLDDVDEQSSAAFNADAGVIRQIQAGGETPASAIVTAQAPKLVERLGDTALVNIASGNGEVGVLLIRDDSGWRIRGFLAGTSASG
jgi:serine/threonine protein kinase